MRDKNYDDTYLEKLLGFFEKTKQRSYRLLQPQPTDVIADVGCGTGQDAIQLAKSGATVYGIDYDPELIAIAQRNAKKEDSSVHFLYSEASQISLDSNSVDKIRYERIFQHLANPESVLKEANRLVKPGGIIQILDTDNLSITLFMEDEKLERKIIETLIYQRLPNCINVRRLPTMLKKAAFKLESIEIHNYLIDEFSFANYIIHFDEIAKQEFDKGTFSKQEFESWQNHRNRPKGQFNMSINLILIMARKQIENG